MLKLSTKFVGDSRLAFDDFFIKYQKSFIAARLNKVFEKLKLFMLKNTNEEGCFDQKLIRFLSETNLQLPWTISQVYESSQTIREIFFDNNFL